LFIAEIQSYRIGMFVSLYKMKQGFITE
jgi:hypothetical protein